MIPALDVNKFVECLDEQGDESFDTPVRKLRRYGPRSKPTAEPKYVKDRESAYNIIQNRGGPVRLAEFIARGIDARALRYLVQEELVLNPFQGIYCPIGSYDPFLLALAVLRAHGTDYVLGLKTAAQYHGLLTEMDDDIWAATPVGRGMPGDVLGFRPVPVHWKGMQAPQDPLDVPLDSEADVDLGRLEQTERYFGIHRVTVYGTEIKVTSPARTVCDLLRFIDNPILKEGFDGLAIDSTTAFEALASYTRDHDVATLVEMSDRLGCREKIEDHLELARSFQIRSSRQP